MLIREILSHSSVVLEQAGKLINDTDKTLSSTWSLTDLHNSDPYKQYRMGLALAAARSSEEFDSEGPFSENMVVTAYTPQDEETLKLALKRMKKWNHCERLSTVRSEEPTDINTQSPIQPRGPIKK